MATTAYNYVANVNEPWDTTKKVVVERDDKGNVTKEIEYGGDPVELTDEERDSLSDYIVLRKATDKQVDSASSTDGSPSVDSGASTSGGAVTPNQSASST